MLIVFKTHSVLYYDFMSVMTFNCLLSSTEVKQHLVSS